MFVWLKSIGVEISVSFMPARYYLYRKGKTYRNFTRHWTTCMMLSRKKGIIILYVVGKDSFGMHIVRCSTRGVMQWRFRIHTWTFFLSHPILSLVSSWIAYSFGSSYHSLHSGSFQSWFRCMAKSERGGSASGRCCLANGFDSIIMSSFSLYLGWVGK